MKLSISKIIGKIILCITLYQKISSIYSSSNHLVSDYTYIGTLKNIVGTGSIPVEQDSKLEINNVYLHIMY